MLVHGSNNKAAAAEGINRRTVDRTIIRIVDRAEEEGYIMEDTSPKILFLDIETAPMQAFLWSLWQRGVNHDNIIQDQYVLSWAAKWLGEKEVHHDALCYNEDYTPGTEEDRRMLDGIWGLMDEADFVVAHNGDKFDIKKLNTRFLLQGMTPPNPYKSIDTLKMVKRSFAFSSNRLDHLLKTLFGYGKDDSGGFETWVGCVRGDRGAWDTLIKYNISDVEKLEELYLRVRPWDKSHPSAATHGGVCNVPTCTVCNSEDVEANGHTVSTGVSVFPVYECNDCGAKMRGRVSLLSPVEKNSLLVKAK